MYEVLALVAPWASRSWDPSRHWRKEGPCFANWFGVTRIPTSQESAV